MFVTSETPRDAQDRNQVTLGQRGELVATPGLERVEERVPSVEGVQDPEVGPDLPGPTRPPGSIRGRIAAAGQSVDDVVVRRLDLQRRVRDPEAGLEGAIGGAQGRFGALVEAANTLLASSCCNCRSSFS